MSRARTIANFGDGLVTADLPSDLGIVGSDLPTGSVVQVVTSESATEINSTTGAEVYTGFSASITPSSASNKVLVLVSAPVGETGNTNNWAWVIKLRRGTSTSDTQLMNYRHGHYENGVTETSEGYRSHNMTYLDSPNSTSQVTYGLFMANLDGSPNARFNKNGSPVTITLMEIAG